jgi:lipoate-protein ligase A
MADTWRVVDTGLRPPAQNIALDRAILEARRREEVPSTLRFLRFTPCALLAAGSSAGETLDPDYCASRNIEVQRRLTGGELMCLDPGQLMWELVLHRRDVGAAGMSALSRRLCHAAAAGISALGVDARFRAPADIEVGGRRVSDGAGVFDGEAVLFQGTLLLDFDAAEALGASRLCGAATQYAGERIVGLKALLGAVPDTRLVKRYLTEAFESEFGVEFREADLTLSEHARYQAALREIDHRDWIHLVERPATALPVLEAWVPVAGGRLGAVAAFDREMRVIRQVWFLGEPPIAPRRTLPDLEAALRQVPLERLEARVRTFFAGRALRSPSVSDFVDVVRRAVREPLVDRV